MAETVVRIAVALDNEGHYEVAGGDSMRDGDRSGYAEMWMEERNLEVAAVQVAEVTVPLAPTKAIAGEVVESEPASYEIDMPVHKEGEGQ